MIGTIIGAGIFALPAAFAVVGFWPGTLLYWTLAAAVLLTHQLYAGLLLASRKPVRLTGLVNQHLDPVFHSIAAITYPLQIVASNYAYLILGGEFFAILANASGIHLPVVLWQLLFWIGGAATVLIGMKAVIKINDYASAAKVTALLLAVVIAAPFVDVSLGKALSWDGWFLPFGVFLFSLSGLNAVGEVVEIAKRKSVDVYLAVGIGTIVSAVLSWLFGVIMYFAARGYPVRTTAELISILPSGWALLIPLLGLLAVMTAYLNTAEDLHETLQLDFKLDKKMSAGLALGVPFILLLVLSRDFLNTIGFIGSVFVGINGLLVCALAFRSFERERRASTRMIALFGIIMLMTVFLFGLVQKILFREIL